MPWSADQRSIVRDSLLAVVVCAAVLAVGAHLILSTVLRGAELRVIPLLVGQYLLGRVTFAWGYARRPVGRAFGMAVTGVSTVVGYGRSACCWPGAPALDSVAGTGRTLGVATGSHSRLLLLH